MNFERSCNGASFLERTISQKLLTIVKHKTNFFVVGHVMDTVNTDWLTEFALQIE